MEDRVIGSSGHRAIGSSGHRRIALAKTLIAAGFRSPDRSITRSPDSRDLQTRLPCESRCRIENLTERVAPRLPTSARMILMVPVTTGEQALPSVSGEGASSFKLAWAAIAYISL